MKHLYLLRHAKSSWDDPALPDHLRPLAPRGRAAVKALRQHVGDTGIAPDLVLCSSARRAVETWEGVAPGARPETAVAFEDDLYGAGAAELLRRLRGVPDEAGSVMVVAHSPGLEELAAGLVGAGDDELRQRMELKFPTGALATLDVAGPWAELDWATCTLAAYVVPRDL
ncbi:MAG: SixA phosphatase family protein [Acidimicrobiales bacterium]